MPPSRTGAALISVLGLSMASFDFHPAPGGDAGEDGLASAAAAVAPTSEPKRVAAAAPEPLNERLADYLEPRAKSLTPEEVRRVADAIARESRRHELDPALVLAVIEVESRYDAFAVSSIGAMGLMQIVPRTGRALAARYGLEWNGPRTLFDPVVNVRLGIAYLRELHDRFGVMRTALAAYNWGPGAIGRRVRDGAPVPAGYVRRVLSVLEQGTLPEAQTS